MKKTLANRSAARPARAPLFTPPPQTLPARLGGARLGGGLALLALLGGLGLLAARPAHSGGGPVPVAISNVPLATTDADNAGRTPFGTQMDLVIVSDKSNRSGYAGQTFTVPAHKRLTLTYVSADCIVNPGVTALVAVDTIVNGSVVESYLTLTSQADLFARNFLVSSGPVTLYADAGTEVTVFVRDTDASGSPKSGNLTVSMYGFLVDAP